MHQVFVRAAVADGFAPVAPGIFVHDLGLDAPTGGAYSLMVVHLEPEGARVEHLHRHEEGYSFAYVLSGWLDVEFAQIGRQHLGPRTTVPAFNGPLHREQDCGDDLRLLLLVTQRPMRDDDAQHIVVQQADEAPLRAGAPGGVAWRDFELEGLSGGRLSGYEARGAGATFAPVTRTVDAERVEVMYLAAGWLDVELSDGGRHRLESGAVACLPPGARWVECGRSADAVAVHLTLPL
ncbi:MAG: hypothetical protein K2Y51_18025 [Gammaproteobacteria bacterium]|nr:hypothetical protein [Gammaproteobacteria bacterium]